MSLKQDYVGTRYSKSVNLVCYPDSSRQVKQLVCLKNGLAIKVEELEVLQIAPYPMMSEEVAKSSLADHSPAFVIAKVATAMGDSIRSIYNHPDAQYPIAIIAMKDHDAVFNHLDVGNVVDFDRYSGIGVRNIHAGALVPGSEWANKLFPALITGKRHHNRDLLAMLGGLKKDVIGEFLKDTSKGISIGIYDCKGMTVSYSDTTMTLINRGDLETILKYLNEESTNDFERDFDYILKVTLHGVIVNGTTVWLEKRSNLSYVNGKRVRNDEALAIARRVLCFADADDAFLDFIRTCASMSLAMHRTVSDGVSLVLQAGSSAMLKFPDHMNLNNGNYHSIHTVTIKVKKSPRKPMSIEWLGKWREVIPGKTNSLLSILRNHSFGNRGGRFMSLYSTDSLRQAHMGPAHDFGHDGHTEAGKKWVTFKEELIIVGCIDSCLRDEDKVITSLGMILDHRHLKFLKREVEGKVSIFLKDVVAKAHAIIERSKELLDEVLAQEGATETKLGAKDGYLVTGMSGMKYFVDRSTAKVYNYATGGHICIVNGVSTSAAGFDYLTSVIAALASDKYTAKKIYTLKNLAT